VSVTVTIIFEFSKLKNTLFLYNLFPLFLNNNFFSSKTVTQSEQDRSCIVLTRLQQKTGEFLWIHLVLQVRDSQDSNQHSVIVCTNQVLR
jgi:hypothetical protein